MISELIIKRPGEPAKRLLLVKVDNRRRLRLARRLRGLGWPFGAIRLATRLTPRALSRALAGDEGGLWGRHAEALRRETRSVP
jgi:hypothetical protein